MDPEVNRILGYYFLGDEPTRSGFEGAPEVNAEIKDRLGDLVEKAHNSQH